MRWFRLFLLFCVLVMGIPTATAHACSCETTPTVEDGVERADQVFIGRVLGIEDRSHDGNKRDTYVLFEVGESWKGHTPSQIVISTPFGGEPSCGIEFQKGQEYLVYAARYSDSPDLATHLCSRTQSLAHAHEDLAKLSKGVQPQEVVHLESEYGIKSQTLSPVMYGGGAVVLALLVWGIRRRNHKHYR